MGVRRRSGQLFGFTRNPHPILAPFGRTVIKDPHHDRPEADNRRAVVLLREPRTSWVVYEGE